MSGSGTEIKKADKQKLYDDIGAISEILSVLLKEAKDAFAVIENVKRGKNVLADEVAKLNLLSEELTKFGENNGDRQIVLKSVEYQEVLKALSPLVVSTTTRIVNDMTRSFFSHVEDITSKFDKISIEASGCYNGAEQLSAAIYEVKKVMFGSANGLFTGVEGMSIDHSKASGTSTQDSKKINYIYKKLKEKDAEAIKTEKRMLSLEAKIDLLVSSTTETSFFGFFK